MSVLKKVAKGAALVAMVNVQRNDVHNEVDRVTFGGIPLFSRDENGRPSILGIPFKRRKAPRRAD